VVEVFNANGVAKKSARDSGCGSDSCPSTTCKTITPEAGFGRKSSGGHVSNSNQKIDLEGKKHMSIDYYNEVWMKSGNRESLSKLVEILLLLLPERLARKQSTEYFFDGNHHIEMLSFWTCGSPFAFAGIEMLEERFSDVDVETAYTDEHSYCEAGVSWVIECAMSKFENPYFASEEKVSEDTSDYRMPWE